MQENDRRSLTHSVATVVIALLLAADVVRLSVAANVAQTNPERAQKLAPGSPAALASAAMSQVGQAALKGQEPSARTMDQLRQLAGSAPLEPEPFLVPAAIADKQGDYARAERLLLQAVARAPRSAAAHYLLSDVKLREGKVLESLRELAVLARILPGSYPSPATSFRGAAAASGPTKRRHRACRFSGASSCPT